MAEKQHFPKMVYLSVDPNDHVIINTQEEWPDGAKAHWLDFDKEDAKAEAKEAKADEKAAKAAKAAATAASRALASTGGGVRMASRARRSAASRAWAAGSASTRASSSGVVAPSR